MTNCFILVGNIEQPDYTTISKHRSLAAAGRAYQAAHTGNMRRVTDAAGKDVTEAACDAANRASCLRVTKKDVLAQIVWDRTELGSIPLRRASR